MHLFSGQSVHSFTIFMPCIAGSGSHKCRLCMCVYRQIPMPPGSQCFIFVQTRRGWSDLQYMYIFCCTLSFSHIKRTDVRSKGTWRTFSLTLSVIIGSKQGSKTCWSAIIRSSLKRGDERSYSHWPQRVKWCPPPSHCSLTQTAVNDSSSCNQDVTIPDKLANRPVQLFFQMMRRAVHKQL